MAETLGHKTTRDVWCALEAAYSHDSVERVHMLRESLRHLQKGSSTIAEFSRKFKAICDQLTAIGHPLDQMDKTHWFLCGLGSSFETFSTTQRLLRPHPSFHDLLSQAESHELFLNTVNGSTVSKVSFNTTTSSSSSRGRGNSNNRGGSSQGRGRGRGRRPPHCQLCRTNRHYANQCPDLQSFARRAPVLDANLAQAFQAQYAA
ncbi:zinc finger, CCHC-type, Gag-polypeptide of LTR copia-type [Artemisia annua]|uniref:Zinc finger, CCHC-type, Gag-polypeptide of LTR copia-type n=1 Tax=Artemisia annua TaxID=35608 RepID=A0A2U1Q4J2_ARTAN|nr:zinc finger, CCHC-type, Gag-polypeptide of LTR copia-type [Artemisia annua]